MSGYHEKAQRLARKTQPTVDGLSAEQLRRHIADISKSLIGPGISAEERIVLNEDRHVYRAALAAREANP